MRECPVTRSAAKRVRETSAGPAKGAWRRLLLKSVENTSTDVNMIASKTIAVSFGADKMFQSASCFVQHSDFGRVYKRLITGNLPS